MTPNTESFTATIEVAKSPRHVFECITDVSKWWGGKDLRGSAIRLNDEFTIRHGDVHYSKQRVIEAVSSEKVVWLITECGFRPSRSAIPADADHPFRPRRSPRARDAAGWLYFAGFGSVVKDPFTFLSDSPASRTLWALWTRRSQTESAMVSSPTTACQFFGSSWLVMTVEAVA